MPLLLYTATALALVAISHRAVRPLSRSAAVILYLLPFCFVGYALVAGRVFGPIDLPYATDPLSPMRGPLGVSQRLHAAVLSDVANQMIPWRKAVQWSLANGQWPLWNPFILSGDVLAAAAQPAAYSPFTLMACLLPVAASFTYTAAIAFFIAALGAFLFLRELDCRESVALIGAAVWMYSTDIAFFILWPIGFSWAFLPLVLLATRRVVRTPSIATTALLTTALTLMLLAGHPETALHVVFVGAIYAVFELVVWCLCARRQECLRHTVRSILSAAIAGVSALLVSAVYLLPIVEAVSQTQQHAYRVQVFAKEPRGATMPNVLARLAIDALPFLHLADWHIAAVDNITVDTAAVGSIALALAIYAMWRVRSRDSWFFTGLAVFCLLARVEWKPVARLLQKLPLFDVALNERLSFAAAFALAVLAALGVEAFLRRASDRGVVATAFVVLVVIAIATVAIAKYGWATENTQDFGAYAAFAEIAGLACATLVLLSPIPRQWLAAILLGLVLLQRTLSAGDIYMTFPASIAYPPVPIFEPLKKIREPFRVTAVWMEFIPNMSALYELEDVRGYEAMTFYPYYDTWRMWSTPQSVSFNRVDDITRPFLNFMNVRFAVVWANFPDTPGWRVAATQRGCKLLENTNAIERAFVPAHVRFYDAEWQAVNDMTLESDFRNRAWIRAPLGAGDHENGPGHVMIAKRKYGYTVAADMQRAGWVVVSETAWKGWRAYVDGKRVEMQMANGAFLSIHVPEGHHTVKLIYKPQSFVAGRAITFATLALLAAAIIARAWFARRTSSSR